MRKEGLVVFAIVFLLVIGISSAKVLNYYGLIKGTSKVEGPTFYASPTKIPEGVSLRELLINRFNVENSDTYFSDGDFRAFASGPLGITDFYPAKFTFHIKAYTNVPSQSLETRLFIYNTDTKKVKKEICGTIATIHSSDYDVYDVSCKAGELSLEPKDGLYWRLTGWNTNESVEFHIKLDGNTRFEVDKA